MTQQFHIVQINPTLFFVRDGEKLRQQVQLTLHNAGAPTPARLRTRADEVEDVLELGLVAPGETSCAACIPDIRQPHDVDFGLLADGIVQDAITVPWIPQRHWEVHLIQYAHHDLGYTDLPSNVLVEYDGFLDDVLRYCAATEAWPEADARFRYQCEQAWSVIHYLENRPSEIIEQFIHFVHNGQIEVTALFGNQTLELCSTEELVRLLYPAFRLKREHGIPITSAEHNDIPGFTWGLASVLAGASIRYFSPGVPRWYFEGVHPLWDTETALPLDKPAACWWEGPDGSRVLLWSDMHGQEWQPYDMDQAMHELPGMLQALAQSDYPYDMVSYTLRGGHRDNAPPTLRYAHLVREWNRRWAYPRLINTTNTPFLQAFEQRWGHTLKTLRGDVPGTDYPVAATCTPKETAVDRNTHTALATAEKLAAVASLVSDYAYPRSTLDKAYRETFYYDLHCWGMAHIGGPAQDAHWSEKGDRAYRAAALTHDVQVKAANKLADAIGYPDADYYITLFNTLGHERTDIARVPLRPWSPCGSPMYWQPPGAGHPWPRLVSGRALDRSMLSPPLSLIEQPFEIVDVATEECVPYQLAILDDPQAATPWAAERVALDPADPAHRYEIVFPATAISAMGYTTYQLRPCEHWPVFEAGIAPGLSQDHRVQIDAPFILENRFYRLTMDPTRGVLTSLFDKALGHDWVDREAPHGFGQFVVRTSDTAEEEVLHITSARLAATGPLYTTLRLKGATACCPRVTVEYTLYHTLKRVEVAARILRDSTPQRELYLAFPFDVRDPHFHFEAPGAVIEPLRDQWPGSCTDLYAVQQWANVSNAEWGMTWTAPDTPMAAFGGLWPGYVSGAHHGARGPGYGHPFLQPGELNKGHIYALLSYHNFRTNFVNVHPGEFLVRYAFRSHAGDWRAGAAWTFGQTAGTPLVPVWMRGVQPGVLPMATSFCRVDAPNANVLTFKQAEDGEGYILRLQEVTGQETAVTVTLPYLTLADAAETNLVEEGCHPCKHTAHTVKTTLHPWAIHTLRIRA